MNEHTLKPQDMEQRAFPLKIDKVALETRATGGRQEEVITGRAVVFDEFTTIVNRWGDEFKEKFTKNCMDETLADGHKIMALYNHSWLGLMGSTNDNLKLELRADGLYFEFTAKVSDFDRRIVEHMKGGTIEGCSIGYRVLDHYWEEKAGEFFRIITKIELYEISFTPIPAYESTSVNVEVRGQGERTNAPGTADAEERSRILQEMDSLLKTLS